MYISFKPNNTIFYFALRSHMVFKELQKGKMELCESRNISICIYTHMYNYIHTTYSYTCIFTFLVFYIPSSGFELPLGFTSL